MEVSDQLAEFLSEPQVAGKRPGQRQHVLPARQLKEDLLHSCPLRILRRQVGRHSALDEDTILVVVFVAGPPRLRGSARRFPTVDRERVVYSQHRDQRSSPLQHIIC